MKVTQWLSSFSELHERMKNGADSDVRAEYKAVRDDFAAFLLGVQKLSLNAGEALRQSIRVSRAVPIEFDLATGPVSSITFDISIGGLSTVLSDPPPAGTRLPFRMRLAKAQVPVSGLVSVVKVFAHNGSPRVACRFEDLSPPDRERLELMLFDHVVAQLLE